MSLVGSTSSEEYHSGSLNRVTFAEGEESTSQVEGTFSVNSYELNERNTDAEVEPVKTENELLMEKQQFSANYLHPTMASSLPPFTLGEVDRIRDSYRTGSYWSVKKLPSKIEPGSVQLTRKQHTVENLIATSNTVFKPTSKHNSVFNPQVYVGTDYDKVKSISKSALEEEKIRIASHSRKPFVISSRVRSKTEDIFYDPEYKFPHLGGGTGVFRLESITRSDLMNEDKFLKTNMSVKTSVQVQEWLHAFYDQLSKDWPDYLFKVKFTKTDELLVQFEKPNSGNMYSSLIRKWHAAQLARANDPDAAAAAAPPAPTPLSVVFPPPNNLLNKYMHRVSTHGLAYEYGLKKRGDRWNIYELEHIDPNSAASLTGLDTLPSDNLSGTILPPLGTEGGTASAAAAAAAVSNEPQWYVPPGSITAEAESGGLQPLIPPVSLQSAKTGKSVNFHDQPHGGSASNSISHGTPRSGRHSGADSPSAHVLHREIHSQEEIMHELEPIAGKRLSIGSLIIHLMKSHTLKGMARGVVDTLPALHQHASEDEKAAYEREMERQRQEDRQIHYLTFSFYAPWVNKGQRHIIQKTSQADREKASKFGSKLRQKYRLDPVLKDTTAAGAAGQLLPNGIAAGDSRSDAAGGNNNINNSSSGIGKKSIMKKKSVLQSSFEREMEAQAELEEMSFGSMSSTSSMMSRRSMNSNGGGGGGGYRKNSHNLMTRSSSGGVGALLGPPGSAAGGGGAGLDSEDTEAVMKAVNSVVGGEGGEGGAAGFNGTQSSGSSLRRGMSVKKSLRSFSKSSFSADNQLIPFA